MSKIRRIEQAYAKADTPAFNVGDTVDVHVLIREGEKERVQVFSGTVIRKRGSGMGATYTVRRIVQGQGLERVFPMHSPFIEKVEVKRSGRVRRSRLYFLRDRRGKATRLKEIIRGSRPKRKREEAPEPVAAPVEPPPAMPEGGPEGAPPAGEAAPKADE